MFRLRPQPQTLSRRGSSCAPGALFGARLADSLDEQRVDAAVRVVARNTRQTAVDDQPDALDRDGGLGHIRGNDHFRMVVLRNGLILIARRQFTMQRKKKVTSRLRPLRSEEHTSELQSLTNLVCRLLLEKKKSADDCSLILA